jgi:hypothetical protein
VTPCVVSGIPEQAAVEGGLPRWARQQAFVGPFPAVLGPFYGFVGTLT